MKLNVEQFIRRHIQRILVEQLNNEPQRSKGVRGGVKKELRDLKAIADTNPGELMSRLKVSRVEGEDANVALSSLMNQAVSNTQAMSDAYVSPTSTKDSFGRNGILISLTPEALDEMSVRDATIFIRHTVRGARNAGLIKFPSLVQIEILGDNILVYPADKKFTWNVPKAKPDAKETPKVKSAK
tara:strand:- start:356 stop:907 length:552 start_codon:yes stop_codon:yes gene_type:complete